MASSSAPLEQQLRAGFKYFNRFMLLLWRLGLGRWVSSWPAVSGRIMVLTTIGRTSGQQRRTPLNYAISDTDIYCVAGFGSIADWYRNLRVNPAVEIWLPDGWWDGLATEVPNDAAHLGLLRQVLINSGMAARLAGIDPHTFSDEALAAATSNYHLIRIQRSVARTGAGGPGDLAWVWPVSSVVACLLLQINSSRLKNSRRRS